jgi:RHS repeat-associated protein
VLQNPNKYAVTSTILMCAMPHSVCNIFYALISSYPSGDYTLYAFLYDSLNRRVCIGRCETHWPFLPSPYDWQMQLHDGNVPIAVSHPADAISHYFVRGAGIAEGTGDVIAEIIGTDGYNAKAVFYMSNHRGDTLATYRGDKTMVAKYRFDAFGNQRTAYCVVNEPENAPRYTFSTKEYLADAVLYLYAYRVYDPVAGRWTQRDPIDYQDSLNLYCFSGNNPENATDPDGRAVNEVQTTQCDYLPFANPAYSAKTPEPQSTSATIIDAAFDSFTALTIIIDVADGPTPDASLAGGAAQSLKPAAKSFAGKSLSAVKKALSKVHAKIGKQAKSAGQKGKFGSPQAGNSTKGYRLDPGHTKAPPGTTEASPHLNYWDYSKGKKGSGGTKGSEKIGD